MHPVRNAATVVTLICPCKWYHSVSGDYIAMTALLKASGTDGLLTCPRDGTTH
jgi:hypothetical protein